MKKIYNFLFATVMMLFTTVAFAQATITGKVVDAETTSPLPGANVAVKGTSDGATTDFDGNFTITTSASSGEIVISYVGFKPMTIAFNGNTNVGTITLNPDSLDEVVIVGTGLIDLAQDRKTPVAVSTIYKKDIQEKAQGNVEFPEILENTPNVYVSNQAGGFGDSQVFTRGFDQTNTAFLLNGQPINGMEDGRMYWSNWAGMSEIANAVQVQRGLGSSKLAISSVGGTVNIITKATEKSKGGNIQFISGNDSYLKAGASYNSGLNENGWGFSVALSHWQAHRKFARGTEGSGQNYFISVGKKAGNHNFNFLITGAPQYHGQNYSKAFDYGNGTGYNFYGEKWNFNSGFLNGESFTWRRNYYHKPVANLNWDWQINDNTSLSTVLYASWGRGGGTGDLGDDGNPFGNGTGGIYPYNGDGSYYVGENGYFDFDRLVSENQGIGVGGFRNGLARRASVNNHNWYGLVTNFNSRINDKITYNLGFDARTYRGDHFRQITDLLGLDAYQDTFRLDDSLGYGDNIISETFNPDPWAALFNFADEGERVNYDYSEDIKYFGGFGQIEFSNDNLSMFAQGALSTQSYQREGRWADVGKSDKIEKLGYNAKIGMSYRFDDENSIYTNFGHYSRQPFLDNIFDNIRTSNELLEPEVENEEITGFEFGYALKKANFSLNLNAYYTKWGNRFLGLGADTFQAFNDVTILFTDITQAHKGFEIDLNYRPISNLKVNGYFTYGDWEFAGSSPYRVRDNETQEFLAEGEFSLDDVKVGQAPQLTAGLGVDYKITEDLSWDANYNFYGKLYGFVDAEDIIEDRAAGIDYQAEELDDYFLVNSGVTYNFNISDYKLKFRANVRNVFNNGYINQRDQFGYFLGLGRTWNASLTYSF